MFGHKLIEIENPLHTGYYGYSQLNPEEDGANLEEIDNDYIEEMKDIIKERYPKINRDANRYELYIDYNYEEYKKVTTQDINSYFIEKINELAYDLLNIEDLFFGKIEDECLTSPKEYNFDTDHSYFKIKTTGIKYHKFLNKMFNKYGNILGRVIKERHTSYDGFHSFMSNSLYKWAKLSKNEEEFDYRYLKTIFITMIIIDEGWTYENFDKKLKTSRNWLESNEILEKQYEIATETYLNIDKCIIEDISHEKEPPFNNIRHYYDYEGNLIDKPEWAF